MDCVPALGFPGPISTGLAAEKIYLHAHVDSGLDGNSTFGRKSRRILRDIRRVQQATS